MTSSEARSNVLTQEVKTLKTEGNFFNSYRFCCAALTLLLLVVLLLLVAMADLFLSTFQRIPQPENMDTMLDEMQIYVIGLKDTINFSQNVNVPDQIPTASTVKDYLTMEGFLNFRLLLGNPWKQRMKLGKIEGKAWLGDGDLEAGIHLADVKLLAMEAIEPKQSAEHIVSITFQPTLYDAVFAGADILKLVMSSTSQKMGISVDFKFRDIWLELFFSKRWTVGFDIKGTFQINNNLGLETLGLCANMLSLKGNTYNPVRPCWVYWADQCAPCVKCTEMFATGDQEYVCEPATQDECDKAQTCRQKQNGTTPNQFGYTDVIGTSCSQRRYVRRLGNVTRRWTNSYGELTSNYETSTARRRLKTQHNDQGRQVFFATYYQEEAENYSVSTCKAAAKEEWSIWFLDKLQKEFVNDLISDLKQGKLPFMPSNPTGTLFYHFFLPMILAIVFLFTVSLCICCRVFGVHGYYLYQERRRSRKKEQDQRYMNRLEQYHPEFHQRQGPNSHSELHHRHASNNHPEFYQRQGPNSRP
eukprot:GEMP01026081.1.p1 GENE.GEMP01026081.1~~GEMP01026081.1.p1  ORF type:complete len:536 (+),score=71.87 GEMP01026081.1:22-1608(+)